MGQQMQREESEHMYRGEATRDESYGYTPQLSQSNFEERPRPYEEWSQKVNSIPPEPRQNISAGQRLALAIVSVSVLVPLVAILIEGSVSNDNAGNFLIISSRLIALLLVCLTIMVVNLACNRRH